MAAQKVSVRIPAYNHEKYIERCLDSVLEDSYPNKELVIINDGSTDRTPELIDQWIKKNQPEFPVLYESRENRGLPKTLNELVALCCGKYLVSLASDDYLLDGGIEERVRYLDEHTDKFAVISDCIVVDDGGNLLHDSGLTGLYSAKVEKYYNADGLLDEIISNWSVPGPVLMVRRSLYDKVGQYNEKLEVEDWDLYIRMASQKLLGFVNKKVSAYRLHDKNICRRSDKVIWSHKQRLRIAIKNLANVPSGYKISMLRQVFFYFYLAFIRRGNSM
ncbi:glycosyltransferase family 2 protein [endosymbiont of Ridgeia piscesae]|uniref:Glycosyl transferase family 2 n=1 Tax=endosymbiont of Ridgeia piscesae TaxID=54398 RepID=A0A0T5Z2G9_9GAMM|nr:glycosyltransferase [endosymbiont of Ridgeia piscesae]KRT55834.1 Glycosyl transferase family 2 [endosymbiont of Ridgeia piscesae]KRT57098.1 Glycosyl transferase family 2 [endosymbiont of Ridgeia piscesae]